MRFIKYPNPCGAEGLPSVVYFTAIMCLFICFCFDVSYSMLYLGLNCPGPNKEAQEGLSHCRPP